MRPIRRGRAVRRRARETWACLALVAASCVVGAAITAPGWAGPWWLGRALAAFGWAAFFLFALGQAVVSWKLYRRPVATRPWILGGPPHPPPPRDPGGPEV